MFSISHGGGKELVSIPIKTCISVSNASACATDNSEGGPVDDALATLANVESSIPITVECWRDNSSVSKATKEAVCVRLIATRTDEPIGCSVNELCCCCHKRVPPAHPLAGLGVSKDLLVVPAP